MKQVSKWPNGKIREEGRKVNGLKEGLWKDFYEDETIRRKVYYKNGEENGSWKSYRPDRSLMWEGIFKGGKITTTEGNEINKGLNDRPEGWWEMWDEYSVVIIRGFYENGKRQGYCEDYGIEEITKGFFTDGVEDGFFEVFGWWDDQDDGVTDEPWKVFLIEEGYYREGQKEGNWKYYWKSGQLKKQGSFEKSEEVGLWKEFDKDGKLLKVEFRIC